MAGKLYLCATPIGNLEDITIEGVTDVLKKLERKPKAVLLFTVCLHHFLGCDLKMVYEELDRRFPEIAFVRCYMDPIMQKTGLTPDQKLRKAMYDPLKVQKADPRIVTLLGHNFPLDETSDIKRFLKKCGCELREITTCDTWDKYEKLGEANIFLSIRQQNTGRRRWQKDWDENTFICRQVLIMKR